MKIKHIFHFLLVFTGILLQPESCFAQESDLKLWTRFAVKYDINKNLRLDIEEEFRFYNNVSMLEQKHTEIGLKGDILKRLSIGAYYRFIYETDFIRDYSLGHRGYLEIELLLLDMDLEISVRNRLQATGENIQSSKDGHIPEWYNRYKLSFEYKPKNAVLVPGAATEFWHALNQPGSFIIDKMRSTVELEYRYKDHWRWKTFYCLQNDLQVANPGTDHILGVAATYMIN